MRTRTSTAVLAALVIILSYASRAPAASEDYPARPIRMIVTVAPGGNADTVARIIGQQLSETLRQPVVIDNRAGANSMIGTDLAVKSPPDGYTLVLVANSYAINPSVINKMPYDTPRDLAPIGLLAMTCNVLVINPNVNARSVKELIAIAKAKPGQLNYGSSGNGSNGNLAAELLFTSLAGVRITQVPYKGTSQLLTAVTSGEVELSFTTVGAIVPHVKAGRLRALGVTSLTRSSALPDIPAIAEVGFPGYRAIQWNGLLAPAATPKPIIATLNRELLRHLKTPELQARFTSLGIEPLYGTPAEFDSFIREEIKQWAKVIKEAGIKLNIE